MACGFDAEKTSYKTRYSSSSLVFGSLLSPHQNALIRAHSIREVMIPLCENMDKARE